MSCVKISFIQISKCLGKNFQPNGHGVDAKDLAEKMQRLSTEVSKPVHNVFFISFWLLLFAATVYCKLFVLYFQRSDEASAVADARTSGSVSPSDFFSQTPKENSNFQIPVSCGKIPICNTFYCVITLLGYLSFLFVITAIITAVCVAGIMAKEGVVYLKILMD